MSQADKIVHPDALELAALLRPTWPAIDAKLHASGVPLNEGEGGNGGGEGGGEGGSGGEGGNGGAPAGGEGEKFDADYVKQLRAETAGHRKKLRDTEARLKELEDKGLSEAEKLKKEAEDGKALAATGTSKLRTANLIVALAEKGLSGGRAKAAAKLLDGVEFDDADEPTNLDAAIKHASETYGADVFGTQQGRSSFDGGARGGQAPAHNDMDARIRAAAGRH
jgi:hypothetical protein